MMRQRCSVYIHLLLMVVNYDKVRHTLSWAQENEKIYIYIYIYLKPCSYCSSFKNKKLKKDVRLYVEPSFVRSGLDQTH